MSLPRTSKEKSARINWGYHSIRRPMTRTRTVLWVLAAVFVAIPLVAATVVYAVTDSGHRTINAAASRGPLANPHAAWDNQCEACHVPFQPVTGDKQSARFLAAFGIGPTHQAMSGEHLRCEQCHAGPPHHPLAKTESTGECASCHRDHQGRNFSLVRLEDASCTRCHRDMAPHHLNPGGMAVASQITSFAKNHPEFHLPEKHKRSLKFSHAVHMSPGMGLTGKNAFSLSKMENSADRVRYGSMLRVGDPTAALQLDCAACHKLDAKGAYFEPVTFEANCKACHPLTFDESPGLRNREVPHHVQPDGLDRFLREVYAERYILDALKPPAGVDRGTGRVDPRPDDLDPQAKENVRAQIETAVNRAKRDLFAGRKTCLECHAAEFPTAGAGVDPRIPAKILPVSLPTRWLTRGQFDHTAHRAVRCDQCHPGAFRNLEQERSTARQHAGGTSAEPEYQHPADIPGIANCRECHAPARIENGVPIGGIRDACTDCHRYHNGDRVPKNPPSSITDFLRGRPGK